MLSRVSNFSGPISVTFKNTWRLFTGGYPTFQVLTTTTKLW